MGPVGWGGGGRPLNKMTQEENKLRQFCWGLCWNGTSGLANFLIYHIYHFIGLYDNIYVIYIYGVYDWKKFANKDLEIELASFIDNKRNVWFKGKDVAQILGYSDTNQAIRKHVSENHNMKHIFRQPVETTGWSPTYFIDEAGSYELVFSSKLPVAKKVRDWVFTTVLPSIRKYGQYKLFW